MGYEMNRGKKIQLIQNERKKIFCMKKKYKKTTTPNIDLIY